MHQSGRSGGLKSGSPLPEPARTRHIDPVLHDWPPCGLRRVPAPPSAVPEASSAQREHLPVVRAANTTSPSGVGYRWDLPPIDKGRRAQAVSVLSAAQRIWTRVPGSAGRAIAS